MVVLGMSVALLVNAGTLFVTQAAVRLCEDLAAVVEELADELAADEVATAVRRDLLCVGEGTSQVERVADLSADVVLGQIRSLVVDLLQITGMDVLEATDALPPPRA